MKYSKKFTIIHGNNISEFAYILSALLQADKNEYVGWDIIVHHINFANYLNRQFLLLNQNIFGVRYFTKSLYGWIDSNAHLINSVAAQEIFKKKKDSIWNLCTAIQSYSCSEKTKLTLLDLCSQHVTENLLDNIARHHIDPEVHSHVLHCKDIATTQESIVQSLCKINFNILNEGLAKNIVVFLPLSSSKTYLDFLKKISLQKHIKHVFIFINSFGSLDSILEHKIENKQILFPLFAFYRESFGLVDCMLDMIEKEQAFFQSIETLPKNTNTLSSLQISWTQLTETENVAEYDDSLIISKHSSIEEEAEYIRNIVYNNIANGVSPEDIVIASPNMLSYIDSLSQWINTKQNKLIPEKHISFSSLNIEDCLSALIALSASHKTCMSLVAQIIESPLFYSMFNNLSETMQWIKNNKNNKSLLDALNKTLNKYLLQGISIDFLRPLIFLQHILEKIQVAPSLGSPSVDFYETFLDIVCNLELRATKEGFIDKKCFLKIKRTLSNILATDSIFLIEKKYILHILHAAFSRKNFYKSGRCEIVLSDMSQGSIPPSKVLILCGTNASNFTSEKECLISGKNHYSTKKSLIQTQNIIEGIANASDQVVITYNTYGHHGCSWIVNYIEMFVKSFICKGLIYYTDTSEKSDAVNMLYKVLTKQKFANRIHIDMMHQKKKTLTPCICFQAPNKVVEIDKLLSTIKWGNSPKIFAEEELKKQKKASKILLEKIKKDIMGSKNSLLLQDTPNKYTNIFHPSKLLTFSFREEVSQTEYDAKSNVLFSSSFKYKTLDIVGDILCIENENNITPIILLSSSYKNAFDKEQNAASLLYHMIHSALKNSSLSLHLKPVAIFNIFIKNITGDISFNTKTVSTYTPLNSIFKEIVTE